MRATYVAVHGGAGVHSRGSDKELKKALIHGCSRALESVRHGTSALAAVADAISILEDEPCLNAGYGSNLTLNGQVECDAAIMDGRSQDFGSVGAVSGVKNPIRLAHLVLEHSRIYDVIGRIPPMTLVSGGAQAFAMTHSEKVQVICPDSLVSARAKREWVMWKDNLESRSSAEIGTSWNANDIQDTVGAIVYSDGLAAGVSSGGILLKHPGRIGEAAVFGAGCWAQHPECSSRGMACSISGTGEQIVRAMLAKSIGDALNLDGSGGIDIDTHEVLRQILIDRFWKSCRDRGEAQPNAGVLMLTVESDDKARLWCAFTTPSMAIAYASSTNPTPKALILRRPIQTESQSKNPHVPIFITSLLL